jgi:gas vesicle protein
MNSNTKVALGTIGAALAGAAAGVLLAPKKGTETREMIKKKSNDLTSNARKSLEKGYEKSKQNINGLTEKVKNSFGSNGHSKQSEYAQTTYSQNEGDSSKMATAATTAGTNRGTMGTGNPGSGTTANR